MYRTHIAFSSYPDTQWPQPAAGGAADTIGMGPALPLGRPRAVLCHPRTAERRTDMGPMGADTTPAGLARLRGDYGIDAPAVPCAFGLLGVALIVLGAILALLSASPWLIAVCVVCSVYLLLSVASYLYTTRRGKFHVWAKILAGVPLRGDERVVDLGCGRGAVLHMVAQRLPSGRAVGVDLWNTRDQSGNALEVTQRNAAREGIADRVELQTADLRALPFADASFDLVLSSLAIHNIADRTGREQAIDEAVRVLTPGGRLLIADILAADAYARRLREHGMQSVAVRGLGWRIWYGGPWVAARLVSAVKPA
jgi:SAM-dependent methyltransferase